MSQTPTTYSRLPQWILCVAGRAAPEPFAYTYIYTYCDISYLQYGFKRDARSTSHQMGGMVVGRVPGGPERGLFSFANLSIGILHISSHTPAPQALEGEGCVCVCVDEVIVELERGQGKGRVLSSHCPRISHARFWCTVCSSITRYGLWYLLRCCHLRSILL